MNALAVLALVDTLTFTTPALMPDSASCDSLSIMPEDDSLRVVLERLPAGSFEWVAVDSLTGLEHGKRYGFEVDLAGCAPCAFRVWTFDRAGNRACNPSNAVNLPRASDPVGVPGGVAFQAPRVSPSPVRALASVSFSLSKSGEALLELLDLAGRRVRVLARGSMDAGPHVAMFDAREVRAGLYFVRLTAGSRTAVVRCVVMH